MSLPRTRLLQRVEAAAGTMSFHFEKPTGFTFVSGQFAVFKLINPSETDDEGNSRPFTLSSAPFEAHLMATTRLRDTAFKRVLQQMPLGTELELDAPYGSFTLHNDTARTAVFLTGGIGITPARSILLQHNHDQTDRNILVFYSNNRPEDAAFLDELTDLAESNDHITMVPTMTAAEQSQQQWSGETGYITGEMVARHVADLTTPIYYLCGPPAMVTAMRSLLNGAGVDDDDIRTEEFTGY